MTGKFKPAQKKDYFYDRDTYGFLQELQKRNPEMSLPQLNNEVIRSFAAITRRMSQDHANLMQDAFDVHEDALSR